jgi:O-antigen ligase
MHPSVVGHESSRERFARLIERVVYVGSLILIAWTAIPYGSVEFWWTSFFELAVFTFGGLWALEGLLRENYQSERWRWLLLPAAALVIFCLIQSVPFGQSLSVGGIGNSIRYAVSADPFETRSFALRLSAIALLAIMLLRFTSNRFRLQALILTVIAVGAVSAIFGILRQTMQHAEVGFVLPALPRGIGYGQIISRNQFAFMMEMAFGLTLGMIFGRHDRLERKLFYAALGLPIVAALILANSRGAILTLMCELLLLALLIITRAWNDKRRDHVAIEVERNRPGSEKEQMQARTLARESSGGSRLINFLARAAIVAALLVVASLTVVWVGGEKVTSNLNTVSDELKHEDEPARWNTRRVDIWKATWRMIKDHPVAGVGFGGYWIAVPRYHDASGAYTPQQAHNDYLEIVASGGVIGLLICIWLIVVVIKRFKDTAKVVDPFRRAAWCGAVLGLSGVAIHSIVDFGLHLTINGALCVALIAIGTADIQIGKFESARA